MMNRLNVLYTCDDAYLPLTGISIASVVENNKDREICFYIATESENSENYIKLIDFYRNNSKIEFRYLDCRKYDSLLEKKSLDRWGSSSYYVYWKLFAYDFLDVDNIWYLDSDVICLKKIENPRLEKTIGAVIDCAHADFNQVARINEEYFFFNTGTLYVDVKKWKRNNCVGKVVSYIEKMDRKPLMCDQDILAVALRDDLEVINPKYNYFVGYDYYGVKNSFEMYSLRKKPFYQPEEIEDSRSNIVFYHCLGGVFGRPWEKDNESPIKDEFCFYRKISPWPEFCKERNMSYLFKIEKMLEVLPRFLYNRIHNIAQKIYIRTMRKK